MRKAIVLASIALIGCAAVWAAYRGIAGGDAPAATAPDARPTITLTDLAGRSVTLKQPVERIVLVRGRDVQALAMLLGDELDEKLVAWGSDVQSYDRDTYRKFSKRFPALADVPALGSVYRDASSAEEILALEPDLVIVDLFMKERGYQCVERMEQAGLPLLYLNFSRDPFKDPQQSIVLLGRALGKEERAKQIADFIDAELAKVLPRLEKIEGPRPSVYVECGHLGVQQYGPSYGYDEGQRTVSWGTVMHYLGCRNIAAGVVPSMGPLSPEYLLKEDPDAIVITGACWPALPDTMHLGYDTGAAEARSRLKAFTTRPGWAELKAVQAGRVYSVYHVFCLQMTNFAALEQLAKWLYPGQFDDLDPEAALKLFHDRFMPVDYSGTWMIGLEQEDAVKNFPTAER